jgi:glucokinase
MARAKSYIVGVDLGGTNVRAAVVEQGSDQIKGRSANVSSRAEDGAEHTAEQCAEAVRQALSNGNIQAGDVLGVGVAVPGHVQPAAGMVLWAPNFKDRWLGVPLADMLRKLVGVPVYLGNDANLAALGEFTFGVGREVRHLAMITLGTGIGGGVIIDGRLLVGADGGAAEIGHMIVNPGGRGGHGAFGSVEGEAQRDAICERAERKIQLGRKTKLGEISNFDRFCLTPALIAQAATEGDEVAIEVFEETGYYLGLAVANLINLLNPQMIVIGGGIASAGDLILDPIRRTALACAVRSLSRTCKIVRAELGDNAGIFGGVALVQQELAGAA